MAVAMHQFSEMDFSGACQEQATSADLLVRYMRSGIQLREATAQPFLDANSLKGFRAERCICLQNELFRIQRDSY